jgi:probable rRNA maturation factor
VKAKRRRKTARKPARKAPAFALVVEDARWRKSAATLRLIRRAARLAIDHPPRRARSVTILLTSDERLKQLNRQFRRKGEPTNILSFVSRDPTYWGDVAIAWGMVQREARTQGKNVPAHAAHLTIHGILHLKGYDHARQADRASMEAIEIFILSRLGVADPYTARPYTRTAKAVN